MDHFLWLLSTSRNAVVITTCTIVAALLQQENNPFSIVGDLDPGLPSFKSPPLSIHRNDTNTHHNFTELIREEAASMFILALLGLMGTLFLSFKEFTKVVDFSIVVRKFDLLFMKLLRFHLVNKYYASLQLTDLVWNHKLLEKLLENLYLFQ